MLAEAFSKPGAEHERWFSNQELWKEIEIPCERGGGSSIRLPIASGSLSKGGMLCQIVQRISWAEESRHRIRGEGGGGGLLFEEGEPMADNGSTTFVAKVLKTEEGEDVGEPLLYCDRRYVGVGRGVGD